MRLFDNPENRRPLLATVDAPQFETLVDFALPTFERSFRTPKA